MSSNDATAQGVSNCYVFKSRLQEYAQKAGLSTPTYHTIKEGPSHQPLFRSTVIFNNFSYDSLPGFLNRKAAEQSAAEIALMEIAKSGAADSIVSYPVHETGLCKNLLQEYAQKMNHAMPSYVCKKDESKGKDFLFSCTVEIGGIRYIGAAAKTKKEAELKAAKTALLAIQMSGSESNEKPERDSEYTVVPTKRKIPEPVVGESEDAVKAKKKRKSKFSKRRKKRVKTEGDMKTDNYSSGEVKDLKSDGDGDGDGDGDVDGGRLSGGENVLVPCCEVGDKNGDVSLSFERSDLGGGNVEITSMS